MEKNHEIQLKELLAKYLCGHLSDTEHTQLSVLLTEPGAEDIWEAFFISDMENSMDVLGDKAVVWDNLWENINIKKGLDATPQNNAHRRLSLQRLGRFSAVAAAVLIAFFLIRYAYFGAPKHEKQLAKVSIPINIQPGHDGAVLHLSNGSTINLDTAKDGILAIEGNTKIVNENGKLKFIGKSIKEIYNEISTARGRQWHFMLPDGTKVWLNSSSSIRYPLTFNNKNRTVSITGEVYFEVVHNESCPFEVKVGDQVIQDIGTKFNVNAYKDDGKVKTTLISGSVSITNGQYSVKLKPGQQAQTNKDIIILNIANARNTIAWKDGMFSFDNADLTTVMNELARWFKVSITYNGKPSFHAFNGSIPKSMSLQEVLKILEQAGVHFKIDTSSSTQNFGKIIVEP